MAGPMEIRAGPHHVEHVHRVAAFRGIVAKTYVDTGPTKNHLGNGCERRHGCQVTLSVGILQAM